MLEQLELFPNQHINTTLVNPMVRMHGLGPAGRFCGECQMLSRLPHRPSWPWCELAKDASGGHRSTWPACAKFMER